MSNSAGRDADSSPFQDRFSARSAAYAGARPRYPDRLYAFLASVAQRRRVAWDCGTGNGQAAVDLSRYFERVIATDASAAQISRAIPAPNVEYRVARAESSGLPDHLVDFTAAAQALHWFANSAFFAEVRRVTVPGGILAAWSYGSCHAGADIETTLRDFEKSTLGPYWSAERRWVDEGYRTIPFPFPEIEAPEFELRVEWTLGHFGEYLRSWSAVERYHRERGEDPVAPLLRRLGKNWNASDARVVSWPLSMRVGRIE